MSPKLAVNSKHNNRMLVKHIRHPSRKKCSLCLPWWHRQGQDPAEPLGFPGGLQRDEATSSQAAWRATYLTFQSLNGLWNGNKNTSLLNRRVGLEGLQWPLFGQSPYWFSGAVGTSYHKLGSFYQWKLILHGCGGQKSEIEVSAGLRSLWRLQASILPHLSQPLVSHGLLRRGHVPLLFPFHGLRSLCLCIFCLRLSLIRIPVIVISLFFFSYIFGRQDLIFLSRDWIWAPCIGSTEL